MELLDLHKMVQELRNSSLPKDFLLKNLQQMLTNASLNVSYLENQIAEVTEMIAGLGLGRSKGESKTEKPFSIEMLQPSTKGTIVETGVDRSPIEKYPTLAGVRYPPIVLDNELINKQIIELKLSKGLIYFLRTITHPYRQTLTEPIKHYIINLKENESIPEEILKYLMTGANIPDYTFLKLDYDEQWEGEILEIDNFIEDLTQGFDQLDASSLGPDVSLPSEIQINPQEIKVILRPIQTLFDREYTKVEYDKQMEWQGMDIIPFLQALPKKGNKKKE